MSQSRFLLCLPTHPDVRTEMEYMAISSNAEGRRLPNGTLIVTPEDEPSLLYKFTPWGGSDLAFHEIDIYSMLRSAGDFSGIVRMEGISSTQDYLVRIMERSRAGTLDSFLIKRSKGELGSADCTLARSILAQIAEAMAHVHGLELVHRDLKAENILVFDADENDAGLITVKLSDFDRAVLLPAGGMLGEPVGSLFHMAPELLAGQKYDRKVDIYAFGILICEVLHGGMRPYSNVATGMPGSLSRDEFCEKVVKNDYRPAWLHDDEELKRLAFRCWSHDPRERPEFREILDILQTVSVTPHIFQPRINTKRPGEMIGIGIASTMGKVRYTMEDAVSALIKPDIRICGVFDGLKGNRCSEFAARCLPLALAGELAQASQDAGQAVRTAIETVQSTLRRMKHPVMCGTTATLALIRPKDILVAWLGDSPAWLFRRPTGDEAVVIVPLISAHHADRPDEAERVIAFGGEVRREQKMLDSGETVPWGPRRVFSPHSGQSNGVALSRSLGLFSFSPAISGDPEMLQIQRHADDLYLVIASDGVSEVLNPPKIYEFIELCETPQEAADRMIDAALRAGAPDNASVLIVKLNGAEK